MKTYPLRPTRRHIAPLLSPLHHRHAPLHHRHAALAILLALGVFTAACGSDSPGKSSPDATSDASLDATADASTADGATADTQLPDPAVTPTALQVLDLAAEVDPMIGTAGSGNVIPGALVPHGMVRASPDTVDKAGAIGSYHYEAKALRGFSHTHLEGPGGSNNGYSHVLMMPFVSTITTALPGHAEPFSHTDETTEPGYYAVTLGTSKIKVELTATGHAAVHRYTFPPSKLAGAGDIAKGHLLLDLAMSNGRSDDGHISRVGKREVQGWARYSVHPALAALLSDEPTADTKVYFYLRFDRDLIGGGTFSDGKKPQEGSAEVKGSGAGLWVTFKTAATATTPAAMEVGVGISFVSVAQAKKNLEVEVGDASQPRFEATKSAARQRWNEALSRVQVKGGSASLRTTFYTALYHSLFQPADYTEAGGVYHSAFDGKHNTHNAFVQGPVAGKPGRSEGRVRRFYTDDWCMWDTYRTLHPLGTLVEPEVRSDVAWSLVRAYQEGGWLPKCTWNATGYSRVMTGNPAVVILADAMVKGLYNGAWHALDLDLTWKAMLKTLDSDNKNPGEVIFCGYLNLGTVPDYLKLGWVPAACDKTQSASMTLEYANADWAAARFAEARGDTKSQARLDKRGENWKHHYNPAKGFMQAKDKAGKWVEPFDPKAYGVYFVEATSWIFTFFVPHDPGGLAQIMGGEAALAKKLDGFFAADEFDITNQPSFHIPWLYGRAGQPEKAQAKVRETLTTRFSAKPKGLPGNDDAGSTSAWYALNAMGLYPLSPGDGVWELGVPLFEEVRLWLPIDAKAKLGRELVISAPGASAAGAKVHKATLRGQALGALRVEHARLVKGGLLLLSP